MKKRIPLLTIIAMVVVVVFLAGFSGQDLKNSGGAPAGYTNSPGDGQNCTHCMGGTAAPVTDWITSDIPSSGYEPGNTYTLTLTSSGTGKKGFQLSPQDLSGNMIGTLIPGTGTELTGSGKYITHSSAPSGNPTTWNFQWTAPSSGVGAVTFYASFAVTKLNTKTTTLTVNQSTVGVEEKNLAEMVVFPNPAKESVNVVCTNVTGGVLKLELVNIQGSTVGILAEEEAVPGIWQKRFTPGMGSGIYFLRLSIDNKIVSSAKILMQ